MRQKYKIAFLTTASDDIRNILKNELGENFKLTNLHGDDFHNKKTEYADIDFFLVGNINITREIMEASLKLKLIQQQGVGYDNVDIKAATEFGIPVAITPEGTVEGVAEHTFLLMLSLSKRLLVADRSLRKGKWLNWDLRASSFQLQKKTLGLIGLGRIGLEVARRAKTFGMKIIYYDKYLKLTRPVQQALNIESQEFETVLKNADIVSLHLLLTEETRKLIGEKELRMMKKKSILINTSRGSIIDEKVLIKALKEGWIAGAGLDVFTNEPPAKDNLLFKMENVVLTPHIAGVTMDVFPLKMSAVTQNFKRVIKGEKPINVVNM